MRCCCRGERDLESPNLLPARHAAAWGASEIASPEGMFPLCSCCRAAPRALPRGLRSARMSSRRHRPINMPAPYLKRVWLDPARVTDAEAYPFCLPFLQTEFELSFERAITIIVG